MKGLLCDCHPDGERREAVERVIGRGQRDFAVDWCAATLAALGQNGDARLGFVKGRPSSNGGPRGKRGMNPVIGTPGAWHPLILRVLRQRKRARPSEVAAALKKTEHVNEICNMLHYLVRTKRVRMIVRGHANHEGVYGPVGK